MKHIVTSVFGDGEESEEDRAKRAMNIDLFKHETIRKLGVLAPKDLTTREWEIGDKLEFEIIGIERPGVVEGIKVI